MINKLLIIIIFCTINSTFAFKKITLSEKELILAKENISKSEWESVLLYRINLEKEQSTCSSKKIHSAKICYSINLEEKYSLDWDNLNKYLYEKRIIKNKTYLGYKMLTKEQLTYLIINGSASQEEAKKLLKFFTER